MSWDAPLEADARLAARNAVKIRAALRQSINSDSLFQAYQATQPQKSGSLAQDRARARAWAIMNVRLNLETFKLVLLRIWGTGYLLGDLAAQEVIATERQAAQKSAMIEKKDTIPSPGIGMTIDWENWEPGDELTAMLIKPPKGLQRLLSAQNITIKGMTDTTLNDIGNALGEAVALGLSARSAAKLIRQQVASPSRALSIAITESNRAMNFAAMERYQSAGVVQWTWLTFDPCDKCAQNQNQVVNIGAPYPSGDIRPPAHPYCRCTVSPVIPDPRDASNTAGQVTQVQATEPVTTSQPVVPIAGEWWNGWVPQSNDKYLEEVVDSLQRANPHVDRFTLKEYVLAGRSGAQDRQIINSGFIIRKNNLETRFYGPGLSLTDTEKQEILTFVEKLQATNPIKELKLNIGTTSQNKYGWAVLGGEDMWITPKTAKNNTPNLEAGGTHKMPVLLTHSQRDYTLAHEWGHLISPAEKPGYLTKEAENIIMRISNEFPNEFTSDYSGKNFKEFYAEMFAEWYLSDGLTTNKIVQEMAKEFQWKV